MYSYRILFIYIFMEPTNKECETCGCKEFTVDAGYYYCEECGTRAKEIQEIQYELTQGFSSVRLRSRKLKKATSTKSAEYKLTSWEIYNYILVGLVEELQKLGATDLFKITTLQLWSAYLTNIQVAFTSKTTPHVPKLPLTYKHSDAEILYGRIRLKRKRKSKCLDTSSVGLDHTSLDISLISKQRLLEKRALIEAEYEAVTGTQQSDTNSLFNTSVHTIKTASTLTTNGSIQYNREAQKERLRHMTRRHLNKHNRDQNLLMNCHKKKPSEKYLRSATFVTRNCLWSIIYLALNIAGDKIQLGDMIRYCREGHLSYFNLKHFIPEEYNTDDKNNEILESAKYKTPNHHQIRVVATKIAKIIQVKYLQRPDMFLLCRRYCDELELPAFIAEYVQKLSAVNMKKAPERLDQNIVIPNYEGCAMAYIIFILKLIFGLDDCTEYNISSKINILNEEFSRIDANHMTIFSWTEWCHFIQYRRLVITQKHFPTKLLLSPEGNKPEQVDMFIDFLKKIKMSDDSDKDKSPIMGVMRKVFNDLIRLQGIKKQDNLTLEPTLTPFKSYFKLIINSCNEYDIPNNIINNHSEHDISFYINGSENNIDLDCKELIMKFKNCCCNKDLYIMDVNNEFKPENILSMHKNIKKDIVKIEPIGYMEWASEMETNLKFTNNFDERIKIAKRTTASLKDELNEVKSLKNVANNELNKIKFTKFGGFVRVNMFKNIIVDAVNKSSNSNENKKYRSSVTQILSPMRSLRATFINNNSASSVGCSSTRNKHRKWFVSQHHANPLLKEHFLRLGQQVLPDVLLKSVGESKQNLLNIPRPAGQYWISHFASIGDIYEKLKCRFPASFSMLLEECARTVEMSTLDLYKELIDIEQQFGLIQFPDRNRNIIGTHRDVE